MMPQDLSGIIATPAGVHIIKLESYTPERQLSFGEAKPQIEAQLKNPAREKRTREWELELKQSAKIEILETTVTVQTSAAGPG